MPDKHNLDKPGLNSNGLSAIKKRIRSGKGTGWDLGRDDFDHPHACDGVSRFACPCKAPLELNLHCTQPFNMSFAAERLQLLQVRTYAAGAAAKGIGIKLNQMCAVTQCMA